MYKKSVAVHVCEGAFLIFVKLKQQIEEAAELFLKPRRANTQVAKTSIDPYCSDVFIQIYGHTKRETVAGCHLRWQHLYN